MATILPEDTVQIRCICGYDHDDNFTIQCERCNAWQHAKCVNIRDERAVPDNYLCPECAHTLHKMNVHAAKAYQRQFLQITAHHRAVRARAEQDEEPRRRGRKRASDGEHEIVTTTFPDPKYFNLPVVESTWSKAAEYTWDMLKETATTAVFKEQRSYPELRITRNEKKSSDWNLGLSSVTLSTTVSLQKGRIIAEIVGEVMTKGEYCSNRINQFALLGCPKKGVFFLPGLPLVVDTRIHGSQAVFLRRSSNPNCKVAACHDQKGNLRTVVLATKAIRASSEITLGWHWASTHPIKQEKNAANEKSASLETISKLLDVPLEDCVHTAAKELSEDEEWTDCIDISRSIAECNKKAVIETEDTVSLPDTDEADEPFVWDPPVIDVQPIPSKKRVSLADYMRNRL